MSESELGGYYDEYWRREAPPPCGDPLAPTRLAYLREELRALCCTTQVERLRVLEAGCGAGDLVAALVADGHEAVGMDVSAEALRLAARRHPGLTLVRHSAEEAPWPVSGPFDAVVAFEVLEHLLRPRQLLAGARAALADGGHVALTTPYHGLLKNLAVAGAAFDRHFAVEGDHIRFFSDRALRRLLGGTGFEVERVRHFGRVPGLWAGVFVWARKR